MHPTLGKQLDFKVDPTGAPHVGGNRWAGGSGGSDTAGLGGRGGPYRLWDGNPVAWHQMLSPPDFFREILGEIRFLKPAVNHVLAVLKLGLP